MAGQTIAERFCQTTDPTARHMLQDEAARFGAQCVVSEPLEEKLTTAEAKHILLSIEFRFPRSVARSFPRCVRVNDEAGRR